MNLLSYFESLGLITKAMMLNVRYAFRTATYVCRLRCLIIGRLCASHIPLCCICQSFGIYYIIMFG